MIPTRLSAMLWAAACLLPQPARADERELPVYVGTTVCARCHGADRAARACGLKRIPAHDRAYAALRTPEAEHIAALSGVAVAPTDSRLCLGCHATAADDGPRWTEPTFDLTAGVQCEACHGPGSFHARAHAAQTRGALDAAARLPIPQDTRCQHCHWPMPSHQAVLEQGWQRPGIDALYKTPVNLAIAPDGRTLFVVCEHSDSVVVVDTAARRLDGEIAVGRRPQDAAVSPDGSRLYVTNRMSSTLSIIDTRARQVIGEVAVGAEPHGVLTNAGGDLVVVLNTGEDSISVIDAATLTETRRVPAGGGPWSLALRPDGAAFYICSARPDTAAFRDPHHSEITVLDARRGVVSTRLAAADANMMLGIAGVPRTEVALFTLMRTKDLVPLTRLAQGWTITNGLGVLWPDGRIDQVLLDRPAAYFPDANDVAVSPDGRHALVSSGGSDQLAVIDVQALLDLLRAAGEHQRREVIPNHLGMSQHFVVKRLSVGTNPRGVLFSPDGRLAYVAAALQDAVTVIDAADFRVIEHIDLGGPGDISTRRRGERLFHSADNAFGRQFSCRSCHPDGHLNGLTFDIEADSIGMHPVDNRSLRGILDTAPFKWEGTNPTLERQCGPRLAVFFTRLHPFSPEELKALVHYECTLERPPNRYRDPAGLTPAQRRGKAVFERAATNDGRLLASEERCIGCHYSPYGTSRGRHDVGTTLWFDAHAEIDVDDLYDVEEFGELGIFFFTDTGVAGMAFDVPHLNDIHMSGPFLHNGAAPTLEEIWTRFNMLDRHGYTRDLTRRQLNDLMAYLKAY